MNLCELLDELRVGILHDTSSQAQNPEYSDYLWSDRRLITYINEAQRKFATLSQCIRDGTTPEVTTVQLVSGQTEYSLHPSVIAVISARVQGDRVDLVGAGHSALSTYRMPDAYFFDPGSLDELPPGKVVAYDTDEYVLQNDTGSMQVMNIRFYPKPINPYIKPVRLRVVRKPIYPFTEENLKAYPEIPDDHHLDMLDWAAHLAFTKADRDAEDLVRADRHEKAFMQHVEEAKSLLRAKMRYRAQWGFGRNGFSWATDNYY